MRLFFTLVLFFLHSANYAQQVITIAGIPEVTGAADGPANTATFNNPHGIAVDEFGNVYVVDRFGHTIRKYDQNGMVSTIAGSGQAGNSNGFGSAASFNEPYGICIGNDGNIFVADTRNNLIRKITPSGLVNTFAGSGAFGATDGFGTNASFGNPTGLEMAEDGSLYVADHLTHVIRKISPSGYVSTIAGIPGLAGYEDGSGSSALFNRPYGLSIDVNGDILVADEWNHCIRRIDQNGNVSTVAGTGTVGYSDGQAINAAFNYPWDMTVDLQGNIYVADGYNQTIRKLSPTGSVPESYIVSTYAGQAGETGMQDGYGTNAKFNAATSIHYWKHDGVLYLTDAYNNLLRKIIDHDRPPVNLQLTFPISSSPENDFFCKESIMEFSVSPDSFEIYSFYVNNELMQAGSSTFFAIADLPNGPITVSVVATDAIGSVGSNIIQFEVQEFIAGDFVADQINLSKDNDRVHFEPIASHTGYNYYWDFGDEDAGQDNFSTSSNPRHTYSGPGTYSVMLIVENTTGCLDTIFKENLIHYRNGHSQTALFIPDAFSPNGDGKNDILYVRGGEIADLEFYIYNQWGNLVFESRDQLTGWDGSFKGNPAMMGTYTYLVKAKLFSNKEEVKSGHVSILR